MALDLPGGLFEQRDVRETATAVGLTDPELQSVLPPIGAVTSWLKSYTNTPQTLPTGWVECDGAVLSDADSVYNGQTLPDLNGGEFLRGDATSGGTGGADTMAHTHTFADTSGNESAWTANQGGTGGGLAQSDYPHTHDVSGTTGAASNAENRPKYYNVVWIMRIK